ARANQAAQQGQRADVHPPRAGGARLRGSGVALRDRRGGFAGSRWRHATHPALPRGLLAPGPGRDERRADSTAVRGHRGHAERGGCNMTRRDPTDGFRLSLRPSRQAIGRVAGAVHLLVHAEPPVPPVRPDRRPVAMALVIDRSGSMGDATVAGAVAAGKKSRPGAAGDTGVADKLSFVKAATVRLLDLMQDGDAVTLVTFDDTVRVV